MPVVFDGDKYLSSGDWKIAADPESSHYEKLGFSFGVLLTEREIKDAFLKRNEWWQEKSKLARISTAHTHVKVVGLHIGDAIKYLETAQKTLIDPIKRAQYDKELKNKIIKKAEEELIKFIQFTLQGDNPKISQEQKHNLLNMPDALKIGKDRAEEIIASEMKKVGAEFKTESVLVDGTMTSMPFDVLLNKTYYEILGVPEDANYAQIKDIKDKEYKKYNDTRDKSRANARWLLVSEACETLIDSKKRKEYDDKLRIKRETSATFKTYLDFSSGERATSLIEAANIIDKHWEEAKQKLVNGYIEGWLGSNGNTVLAVEVKSICGSENNKDIALEKVIQAFKVGSKSPSIEISPTSINFAAVESGKSVSKSVQITNTGDRGFLYGEIKVPDFVSISNSEIALKSKESISITLTIDTTKMVVQKDYKASIKTITNSPKDAEMPILLRVTYPTSQTAIKFIQYGGIGAIVGVCLRGILNGAGLNDWLFRRYEYLSWQAMWTSANKDHAMISIVFILFLLSLYWGYRALRK